MIFADNILPTLMPAYFDTSIIHWEIDIALIVSPVNVYKYLPPLGLGKAHKTLYPLD